MFPENSSDNAVLINFSAQWCEPCKWADPILQEVVKSFDGKIELHKIDIDEQQETARQFHILSVPTLVLMKKGSEVWRMRGFDTAPNLAREFRKYL